MFQKFGRHTTHNFHLSWCLKQFKIMMDCNEICIFHWNFANFLNLITLIQYNFWSSVTLYEHRKTVLMITECMWSLQYPWWNLLRKKSNLKILSIFPTINPPPLPPPIENGNIIICYLGISRPSYQIYIFLNHLVVWNTWDLLTNGS